VAVTVVAGLVLAACGGDDDDAGDTSQQVGDDTGTDSGDTGGDAGDTGGDSGDTGGEGTEDAPVVETLPPEETGVEAVVGGTLHFGLEADVNGLNPTASSLSSSGYVMSRAVFDPLVAATPDNGWAPYLAESFTPNDDFTEWTLTVRPGIVFHDGEPLNADAVIANFEAQRAHPLVGLAVKPFFPEEGAVEKVDDMTVVFHPTDPDAHFPMRFVSQLGLVASPKWLADAAEDATLNQAPVGTGPFRFDSRSEDSVTRVVRNDEWWNGQVYLDAVEFFPVPDGASRVDLLFGGELEGLHTDAPAQLARLRDDDSLQNILNDSQEEEFAMMNSAAPPFDDIRAREALARATPRQLYLDLIGLGQVRAADGMFPPESPYFNPDVKQVGDDPDRALELVAEYCAERGTEENPITGEPTCTDGKINIEYQWSGPSVEQTRIADLLIEGWSVAFNVTRDELLQDEHITQTALGQFNVNTWRQFGYEDPMPDNTWLLCRTIGGISLTWPRFCDEERVALLLEAQALPDEADRAPLYQQVEQKVNEDYLYVFLYHTLWDIALADNVRGVCDRLSPEGTPLKCESNGSIWFSTAWLE
jgi:peptide/nickel transport system substrate-binding protein